MTRIIFAIWLFLVVVPAKIFSQQETYLVLIDEEQQQPFYVRLGTQTINSSSQGHLAIAHLQDSTYELVIGFPHGGYPEQRFSVTVNNKDLGYQLRNLGTKGWALYNWQTLELTTALNSASGDSAHSLELGIKKDDAFSRLMADVVNDTLVMYTSFASQRLLDDTVQATPAAVPPPVESDSLKSFSPVKADSSNSLVAPPGPLVVAKSVPKPEKKKVAKPAPEYPIVKKLVQRPSKIAMRIVYVDISKDGIRDTITMLIPFDKDTVASSPAPAKVVGVAPTKPVNLTDSQATVKTAPAAHAPGKKPFKFNPVCIDLASDYDLDVARVNILTATSPAEKLAAARKAFSVMCFSVKQIRNLSELFSGDNAKLGFFKAVYPHTSDQDHFGLLRDTMNSAEGTKHFMAWLPK